MSTQVSSNVKTAAQIRREFLDYFTAKHDHAFVPSSPVVPHDDPTLLFTNAGMNQFKDVFLGRSTRDWTRAVNTQKCIRAGGKHNDLEDVGKDTYHHTFFEMLGNWSFGDYFKAEAIEWAWQLLTEVWSLNPERLYVTVFEGDESDGLEPDIEAEEIWKKFVPAERISRWGKKDNFWEMGESGPCGPCSEIHYDGTPRKDGGALVNTGHPDVIEIWNLVFIQFNRGGGKLTPLPAKHVDTGMGLERITRVIQGKSSNYDIDLFTQVFDAIAKHTSAHPYQGDLEDPVDIAYRVIADHIRCLTIAISDGARPGNEGRGYVLRRILRRAVRHAHQTLETRGPWLHELVPVVVNSLGDAFPELKKNAQHAAQVIREEEESFLRTLDRGIELFEEAATGASNRFVTESVSRGDEPAADNWAYPQLLQSGAVNIDAGPQHVSYIGVNWQDFPSQYRPSITAADAFRLHDTYGFPIDLTRIMAEERGMTVDEAGYEKLMAEARERSRQKDTTKSKIDLPPDAMESLRKMNVHPTRDEDKYHGRPISTRVRAIWTGNDFDQSIYVGTDAGVIVERTNHYAEAGGQVGDRGNMLVDVFDMRGQHRRGTSFVDTLDMGSSTLRGYGSSSPRGDCRFRIRDTQRVGEYVIHFGRVIEGNLEVGDEVHLHVDLDSRRTTMANHTGTHLLNLALRTVVGEEVEQKGSLVAEDRLRFDFACSRGLNVHELEEIQRIVNELIQEDLTVHADEVPLAQARQINGVRAVFGEKYPDPVRVVSIGPSIGELVANPDRTQWSEFSIEFCGGTHLTSTEAAQRFVIVSEQALAAGVRRIVALTGTPAIAANIAGMELLERADAARDLEDDALLTEFEELSRLVEALTIGTVLRHHVTEKLHLLRELVKKIRREAQDFGRSHVVDQARVIAESESQPIIIEQLLGGDKDSLLVAIDVMRAKTAQSAVMFLSECDGKVAIVALVPESMIKRGLKAGDWVREAAKACGGGGGGRPDLAQAGGKDPEKIDDAIQVARAFAERALVSS